MDCPIQKRVNVHRATVSPGFVGKLSWDPVASFLSYKSVVSLSSSCLLFRNMIWNLEMPTQKTFPFSESLLKMLLSQRYRVRAIKVDFSMQRFSDPDYLVLFKHVRVLHLESFSGRFQMLPSCTHLKELSIESEHPVLDTSPLQSLQNLEKFELVSMSGINDWDLSGVQRCPSLRILKVSSYRGLRDLCHLLGTLTQDNNSGESAKEQYLCCRLEELDVSYCENLNKVDILSSCTALRKLNLNGTAIWRVDVRPLTGLSNLQLNNCSALRQVVGLGSLYHLQDLKMASCFSLNLDFQGFGQEDWVHQVSTLKCTFGWHEGPRAQDQELHSFL